MVQATKDSPDKQSAFTGGHDEMSPASYFKHLRYHLSSTMKGMKITIKHMFHMGSGNSVKCGNDNAYDGGTKREIVTYQYPDELEKATSRQAKDEILDRHVSKRHRGMIYLEPSKCIMCYACSKVCPAQCIVIEGVRLKTDNYMTRFTVDNSKCIFCGLCTEVCPSDCIHHGREWDYSAFRREGLVRDLLLGDVFTPARYVQSKKDLETAKVVEANFKKEQDALKAAAQAAKENADKAAKESADNA